MIRLLAVCAVVMFIVVIFALGAKILMGDSTTETIEGYLRLERKYNKKAQHALRRNQANAESYMEQAAMYREKAKELIQRPSS